MSKLTARIVKAADAADADRIRAARLPFRERLTCSVADAIAATGLSEATLYRMIQRGTLATVKVGGRRLVKVGALLELIGEAPQANTAE